MNKEEIEGVASQDDPAMVANMVSQLPYRAAMDCLGQAHTIIRGNLRDKIEKLKKALEEANAKLDEFSKFEASLNSTLTPISESRYR